MSGSIFERHELKYLVSGTQRALIERAMQAHMVPDAYGESTICNIYFDTPNYRLIRRSLEKPVYKEKLRLRSYGSVTSEQDVFLELKKKYKGIVYKRRISLKEHAAMQFLTQDAPLPNPSQIGNEIEYFLSFYGGLQAAVYICYDRCAFFGREDPNFRITFDKNIRWRTEHVRLTARPGGEQILPMGYSLMEIKTAASIPLWLTELLTAQHVYQTSFSKYGKAYESMLLDRREEQKKEVGGSFCA